MADLWLMEIWLNKKLREMKLKERNEGKQWQCMLIPELLTPFSWCLKWVFPKTPDKSFPFLCIYIFFFYYVYLITKLVLLSLSPLLKKKKRFGQSHNFFFFWSPFEGDTFRFLIRLDRTTFFASTWRIASSHNEIFCLCSSHRSRVVFQRLKR